MINEKELEISNISYTNKDFGAIYTEILDLATKLSSLWIPKSSNESDPGVVLLKLLAFVADKLNYNVDKNILEGFMLSATQEDSMRKLCDLVGYYMNYYKSAETEVTFTYKGNKIDYGPSGEIRYITFPKFKTVISNEDSSIQYFLLEELSLNSREKSRSAVVMEGFLNTLNIGDSEIITLDNIDDRNRVYFGESQVAQNGVFIKLYDETQDETATFWRAVDNLNTQDPGKKCFKFGFDSEKGLPYVEFPQDISTLIGDGLSIRYAVTSGYYGNVGVGVLNKLLSPTTLSVTGAGVESGTEVSFTGDDNVELIIKNNSAATNGAEPESIDDAYNNFKKTVGTFETLVTCRDYANYIYNYIVDGSGVPVSSNCQVADRRTDLNKSKNIVSYGISGQYTTNKAENYTDLFLYPLVGVRNPGNDSEYKDSFNLIQGDLESITGWFTTDESPANISYKYNRPDVDDIGLIKILYSLDAKITTTYKVNTAEQLEIKRNILQALRATFYSRNIDYGYEIPYEAIYNCILNADKRIKAVNLKEPELGVQYIKGDNTVASPLGSTTPTVPYTDSPYLNILAKNVLAGRIPLFNQDNRFNYEFGMGKYTRSGNVVGPVLENVESFTSSTTIALGHDSTNPYELKNNELIQVILPKLVDEVEYGTYINYYCNFDLDPDIDTKLGPNDKLLLVYTDSAQNQIEVLYGAGDIIRSNFAIDADDFSPSSSKTKITKKLTNTEIIAALGTDTIGCLGIPTKSSIFKRGIVKHEFDSNIKAAWLVSDSVEKNLLYTKFKRVGTSNTFEYIIGDSEYFIYSLDGESSYEIFGSGTSLRVESDTAMDSVQDVIYGNCEIPNLNDLFDYGVEALAGILKTLTFSANIKFVIQVNDILTLTTSDKAYLETDSISLTNDFAPLNKVLRYKLVDNTEEVFEKLEPLNIGSDIFSNLRIRSRLDLVCGPNKTQVLDDGQKIIFKKNIDEPNEETYILEAPARIRSNLTCDFAGGDNISLDLIDPAGLVTGLEFPYSFLVFTDEDNLAENFPRIGTYWVGDLSLSDSVVSKFNSDGYSVLIPDEEDYAIVLCYISFLNSLSSGTVTISGYDAGGSAVELKNFSDNETISTISYTEKEKLLNIKVPKTCALIKIQVSNFSSGVESLGSITLGTLNEVTGLNNRFKLQELEEESGLTPGVLSTALLKLVNSGSNNVFYYMSELDSSEEIEEDDLSSPFAFLDSNNIANMFSLSYIDLDNSSIEITRSSKL